MFQQKQLCLHVLTKHNMIWFKWTLARYVWNIGNYPGNSLILQHFYNGEWYSFYYLLWSTMLHRNSKLESKNRKNIFSEIIFKLQLQNALARYLEFTSSAVVLVILRTSIRDSSSTKEPSVLVRRKSRLSSSSCILLLLDVTSSINLTLSASSSCTQKIKHFH